MSPDRIILISTENAYVSHSGKTPCTDIENNTKKWLSFAFTCAGCWARPITAEHALLEGV